VNAPGAPFHSSSGAVAVEADRRLYARLALGVGLYAQGLVEGLAAAGSHVLFIAPAGYPEDRTINLGNVRRVRPVRELVDGGSRPRRAFFSLARVAGGLGALLAARFTSSRFIVSIPDPFVFAIWPLMLLRLTGAKILFVCHDPEPHSWSLPARWRWLERAGYRLIYGCASVIVVLSEAGQAASCPAVRRAHRQDRGVAARRLRRSRRGAASRAPTCCWPSARSAGTSRSPWRWRRSSPRARPAAPSA
jgi:hypothetical protein